MQRPLKDPQFENRTVAQQIEVVAKTAFGTDLNVQQTVDKLVSPERTKLMPLLMGMMRPDNLELLGQVVADNTELRSRLPALVTGLVGVVRSYDDGRLQSLGDVFGVLERFDGINADALDIAKRVMTGIFSGPSTSDVGDVLKNEVRRTTESQKPTDDKRTTSEVQTQQRAVPTLVQSSGDLMQVLGPMESLLNDRLLVMAMDLSKQTIALNRIIDSLERGAKESSLSVTSDELSANQTHAELQNAFGAFKMLSSVGVVMLNQSPGECVDSFEQTLNGLLEIASADMIVDTKSRVGASRHVAIAVRRLLRSIKASVERSADDICKRHADDPTTILPPSVAMNGLSAMMAGVLPALRMSSRVVELRATRVDGPVQKVAACMRKAAGLLEDGLVGFAHAGCLALTTNTPTNVVQLQTMDAIKNVQFALDKIGKIFAF